MDLAHMKSELSKRLSTGRYNHVLRVTETAMRLATLHDVSVKKAEQAALFHDIAKCMDPTSLRILMIENKVDERLFLFHHELWHASVGALIAESEFNVKDTEILNAIKYHTTGRAGMSKLEKIIYVADMTEPERNFPGVEELRELAIDNLEVAMEACIRHSVQFLVKKGVPVFPDSIDCYNEHVMKRGIVN
ncbi:bis(5'-nucleosyl)-tetraphosphatase (symmetrical) YqeK [Sporosarcina jiandibaonis]|uniref:bis(5'-nucleosyl)-tetraphosphatase (symmetrical) YqeK n=1 Tax=Sporosarcina jiandibaonis TaxID=2715535 RepID=UPI001551F142|nr:bis(5'-nucleosyl)-tetraphosphatase (symmetrical) YqeK [Sporosarcina jiandibaonis]